MGKAVRKAAAFFHGVFRGMDSAADLFIVNEYRYPHESERDAMRQDWYRVGDQIKKSMKSSDVKTAA